jgi:hypothetical protein
MTKVHYRLELVIDEPPHRVELLHRNVRKIRDHHQHLGRGGRLDRRGRSSKPPRVARTPRIAGRPRQDCVPQAWLPNRVEHVVRGVGCTASRGDHLRVQGKSPKPLVKGSTER